jgi:hypothetical protein
MHARTVCRSVKYPEGLPLLRPATRLAVKVANQVTKRTFQLATIAHTNGAIVTIENPRNSIIWHTQACEGFVARCQPTRWLVDMCMYGETYQKPTVLLASPAIDLSSLSKQCDKSHMHDKLSNWRSFHGQTCVPTPKGGAYGDLLCTAWAACIAEHFGCK